MSGIEILGIAASVIQIADLGGKLSVKLFVFSRKIKNADKSIDNISQDIAATGAVLLQLGNELAKDEHLRLCSEEAISTAQRLVDDCNKVFLELDDALDGGISNNTLVLGWKQRLKYPFLEPQIELLRSNLERLKSSLVVMLNVLIFAGQLRNQETLEVLKDQKELVKTLVEDKNASEKKYRLALKAIDGIAIMVPSEEATREVVPPISTRVAKPAPESAIPRTNFISNTVSTDGVATTKPEMFPIHVWSLPSGLRYRNEEIQHHCALIKSLLTEVSAVKYQIDHGFRDRLHRGVLGAHWEQWAPLRELYGDEALINAFSTHPELVRFWVSKLEAEALGRLTNRRNILSIRDLTPVEGTVEMLHQSVVAITGPSIGPRSLDTALRASTDGESASGGKRESVEIKRVPVATSSDSGVVKWGLHGPDSTKRHAIHGMSAYRDLPAENTSLASTDTGNELEALPEKRSGTNVNPSPPAEKTRTSEQNRCNTSGTPANPLPKAASSDDPYFQRTMSPTVVGIGQALAAADRAERPRMDALGGSRLTIGNPPMPDDSVLQNDHEAPKLPSSVKSTETLPPAPDLQQTVPAKMSAPDASRQKTKARPPVAVVGRVGAAVTGLYKNTKWSRKKIVAEEMRQKEVEEYGSNPNNDPNLPSVRRDLQNYNAQMATDDSGYRGWSNADGSFATRSASAEDDWVDERTRLRRQEQVLLPSKAPEEGKSFSAAEATARFTQAIPEGKGLHSHSGQYNSREGHPANAITKPLIAGRTKYQFEADSDDEDMEDEIEANSDVLSSAAGRLTALAKVTGVEIEAQNKHLERLAAKSDRFDDHFALNTERLMAIDGKVEQAFPIPPKTSATVPIKNAQGDVVSFKDDGVSLTRQEIGSLKTKDTPSIPQIRYENTPLYEQEPVTKLDPDKGYGSDGDRRRGTKEEEEEEEDMMATKQEIRLMKLQDVSARRNALHMATEAEQKGRTTSSRFAGQGKINNNPEKTVNIPAYQDQNTPAPTPLQSYVSNMRAQAGATKIDRPSSPGTDRLRKQQVSYGSPQPATLGSKRRGRISRAPTPVPLMNSEAMTPKRPSTNEVPVDENEDRGRTEDTNFRNEDSLRAKANPHLLSRPTIAIYSPAMGAYVEPRLYSRGDDIPRPAAPRPEELNTRPAARACHTSGFDGDLASPGRDPDIFSAHVEPTGEAQEAQIYSTEESELFQDVVTLGGDRTLAQVQSSETELAGEEQDGPHSVQHWRNRTAWSGRPDTKPSQEDDDKEAQKEAPEQKFESETLGDATTSQFDGEGDGNFDLVNKLLMQWTMLSKDEYMALQDEAALE